MYVGKYVGKSVGKGVGSYVGRYVGKGVGLPGRYVGLTDGKKVGFNAVGSAVGRALGLGLGLTVGDALGLVVGLLVGTLEGSKVGAAVGSSGWMINDVTDDARVTEPPAIKELLSRSRRPVVAVVGVVWKAALSTLHLHTVLVASKDTTLHVTPLNAVAVDVARPLHVGVT